MGKKSTTSPSNRIYFFGEDFISYFFSGTENIGTWGQQNAAIRPENIDMSKLANVGNMGKILLPQSNRVVQANQEYEHLIRVSNTVRDRTQEASSFDQSLNCLVLFG